jgi:hypothetical protein
MDRTIFNIMDSVKLQIPNITECLQYTYCTKSHFKAIALPKSHSEHIKCK